MKTMLKPLNPSSTCNWNMPKKMTPFHPQSIILQHAWYIRVTLTHNYIVENHHYFVYQHCHNIRSIYVDYVLDVDVSHEFNYSKILIFYLPWKLIQQYCTHVSLALRRDGFEWLLWPFFRCFHTNFRGIFFV